MDLYAIVKLVHVLVAIIAVGFNLSYVIWLVKGKMETSHLLFSLKGIKLMDDKIANPCYILALLSGLTLTYIAHYNILATPWIFYSLILFAFMGIVGFGFYSPTLSKQIKILQALGSDSAEYKAIDKKQTMLGIVLFTLALLIVAIMVIKPQLPTIQQ
jgi:hypothetical protein